MSKKEDLIGKRFGCWLVIEKEYRENKHQRELFYICACDCGNKSYVRGSKLRSGHSSCCRKCVNKDKIKNLLGRKIGAWTVLEKSESKDGSYWKCICECGNVCVIKGSAIINGKSKQCRKCTNRRYCGEISGTTFGIIKGQAKYRHKSFEITHQDLWDLYIQQNRKCALTGIEIGFAQSKKNISSETTASLDRIDSQKGYTKDNIQWIHKDVQPMKWKHEQNYFIKLCEMVVNKHKYIHEMAVIND